MADQKVSDLPSLNGADVDAADLLYIVDSSAGAAGSKKITIGQYQLAPVSGGTANTVVYLNGSKVESSSSALTFDGTNFATTGTSSAAKLIPTGGTATGNGMYLPAANTLAWSNNGAETMRLDSSGNLGLGVTPSATGASQQSLEVDVIVGIVANPASNTSSAYAHNAYYDGTNWRYRNTSVSAARYEMTGANSPGSTHAWYVSAGGTAGDPISFTQAMTLSANGRLGLGITSPTSFIHARDPSVADAFYRFEPYSNAYKSTLYVSSGASGDGGIRYNSSINELNVISYGNMIFNVGTTNIGGVVGDERARITSGGDLLVAKTNNTVSNVGHVALSDGSYYSTMSASANTTTTLHAYSTGAAAYRFYVGLGGTVYATSTTITAISDRRLKENIQDLDVGLDKIMALKPRKFDWKAGKGKDKKDDRGWIAQEFEQVFPDMVDTWQDPAPEGEEPYKAVNADLIPVLVKAIQEQQALIEDLRARVAALEAK